MIITKKEAVRCGECGRQKAPELIIRGCDQCKKELPKNSHGYQVGLLVFVGQKNQELDDSFEFCSWECVRNYLITVDSNDRISLPDIYFDDGGCPAEYGAEAFFRVFGINRDK